jgi:hypothetical protein
MCFHCGDNAIKIVDELEAEMPVREVWEVLKMAEMNLLCSPENCS